MRFLDFKDGSPEGLQDALRLGPIDEDPDLNFSTVPASLVGANMLPAVFEPELGQTPDSGTDDIVLSKPAFSDIIGGAGSSPQSGFDAVTEYDNRVRRALS